MTKKTEIKKQKNKKHPKNYIVVFQDQDGSVIKTSFVKEGGTPEPPAMPEVREELPHHQVCFAGWDYDGKPVQGNLVIKACYEKKPRLYLIMYLSEEGRLLGTETVPYGEGAKAAPHPKKPETPVYEYLFVGWTRDLSFVKGDMTVKPIFVPRKRKYKISFYGPGQRLLREESLCYGSLPHPPSEVSKEQDQRYVYQFAGWDTPVEGVRGDTAYHAVFDAIWREYRLEIYNEEEKIQSSLCHYGDPVVLPPLTKKGYTLHWSPHPTRIEGSLSVQASWEFTNQKNRVMEQEGKVYRILNPSVSAGTAAILSYGNESRRELRVPEKIKIGDYYYRPVCIEKNAFSDCRHLRKLILPDSIEEIAPRGLAGCPDLVHLCAGRGLKKIGAYFLKGNRRLKEVVLKGNRLTQISPRAFDQMSGKIHLRTPGMLPGRAAYLFAKGIAGGHIILSP